MQLIEGKVVSASVLDQVKRDVEIIKEKHGITPGLEVVIAGDDPASQVYVRNKVLKATEIGMHSAKHELNNETTQEEILGLVDKLNNDPKVHGILVQSPPPPQIDERAVIDAIDPKKDVDCFHPYNVGKLLIGDEDGFLPCTPNGVMAMLEHYDIETSGKHAVVLGRSNIVGKPMMALLSRKGKYANATVTMCHSRTQNLEELCASADIIVAAIGVPQFVKENMVKEGAVVIDVGINRIEDASKKSGFRLVGDVDFDNVAEKCSYITPVPGGVGPMTIAMLLKNAVTACCIQHGITL